MDAVGSTVAVASAAGPASVPTDSLDAVALQAVADSLADRLAAASEAALAPSTEVAEADSTVEAVSTAVEAGTVADIAN